MPLTPAIGISVIIHLAVITWYKVFSTDPTNKRARKNYDASSWKFLGFVVVLAVAVVIVNGAINIVRVSLTEKHSSVFIVHKYVGETMDYVSSRSNYSANTLFAATTTPEDEIILPVVEPGSMPLVIANNHLPSDCPKVFYDLTTLYHGSLTDYLKAHSLNDSFTTRLSLSNELGIANYTGTYGQNQVLLDRLFVKFHDIPDLNSPACL
jgi:hypothetical protein